MHLTLKLIEFIKHCILFNVFDIEISLMHLILKFIDCSWHWNNFCSVGSISLYYI